MKIKKKYFYIFINRIRNYINQIYDTKNYISINYPAYKGYNSNREGWSFLKIKKKKRSIQSVDLNTINTGEKQTGQLKKDLHGKNIICI